ncbi:hypothetical protein KIK06_04435 [Nocardiopsis sp. EMB25]|uniref:hypothetical protein n=1 Tax=Nocardiopsis sp. EMB25 TaxID=2835867 RepID=UPI002284F8BF|nr:hypothetical protein [Nocardiopsis sp. EMB25]MCY9783137.1 hypothetical protein [Nocardiopsis sp. EMB25]
MDPPHAPGAPPCPSCAHPSCRRGRAARLSLFGGHRAEFAREHLRAASLQARNPHLLIWFGESTLSYWIAGPTGLAEASGPDSLTRILEHVPASL